MSDKKTQSPDVGRSRVQTVMLGGALGAYMGYVFRPIAEPSIVTIILLALVITIVMSVSKIVRPPRPSFSALLAGMPLIFFGSCVILAVLAGRHIAFEMGGRPAVIVMTTIAGLLFGLWWDMRKS